MKYPTNYKLVYKIILGVLVLGICGAAQAQAPQGFMSRLIQIKYSTELYLSHQIKTSSGRTQNEIDTFNLRINVSLDLVYKVLEIKERIK